MEQAVTSGGATHRTLTAGSAGRGGTGACALSPINMFCSSLAGVCPTELQTCVPQGRCPRSSERVRECAGDVLEAGHVS